MVGASLLVSVNVWVAAGLVALVAVIVNGYVPPVPLAGVPEMVAVPLPLSTKLSPLGSVPDSDSAGAGSPVVVMAKLNGAPTFELAVAALVMVGATFSVSVRLVPPGTFTQSDSPPP